MPRQSKFHPMMSLAYDRSLRLRVGWFYDTTYRADIYLVWNADGEKAKAYLAKKYRIKDWNPKASFAAKFVELNLGNTHANIIFLNGWKHGHPCETSYLAHEVFHCAEHILSHRGVVLNTYTTETYAYLIESITRRCLYLLRK